jgi:hypothetical protein
MPMIAHLQSSHVKFEKNVLTGASKIPIKPVPINGLVPLSQTTKYGNPAVATAPGTQKQAKAEEFKSYISKTT